MSLFDFPTPPISITQGTSDVTVFTGSSAYSPVTVRTAEFEDKYTLDSQQIKRELRCGDLIVFRDPNWPVTEQFDWTIKALTANQANQLLAFFNDTIGTLITIRDHYNQLWEGFILPRGHDFAQVGRTDCGDVTVTFTFEGIKL